MSGPEFDQLPEGAVLIALILLAALAGLVCGGLWLGWMLWGLA